ncbi:hypothetical protein CAPTEDRAFT_199042 [Capitella teleta]|uniref:Uncharacterized protein n=1 Tax=Capitella teleta TaxID=283909 RepID=R7T3D4_CAPTE|nr:hypothetical protein CAPTEDRAFT_199042 [Capitella teleta]|eukprot:ELT87116.1 hypothetical protein CAPTEDRAFT_199042 [Capitella teleta]
MDNLVVFVLISLLLVHCGNTFNDITTQTCWDDTFEARCPSPQKILIMQAKYGHIEVSKCVGEMFATLGYLGCYANVTDTVAAQCDSKDRCQIRGDDPKILESKECSTGLPMYMDITYVCIPEIYHMQSCSPIRVYRQLQYILSSDLWDQHCLVDSDQNLNVAVEAATNMKIKLRLRSIKLFSGSEVLVHYGDSEEVHLKLKNEEITEIPNDHLKITVDSQEHIFLIGYQAFGCDDMAAPAYAWMRREGDMATVGCYHSEYEWKMSCVGSKNIEANANIKTKYSAYGAKKILHNWYEAHCSFEEVFILGALFTSDILFALIIGVTVLLCAIVITIGYVCLKRSKYVYEAKNGPYEMATMMSDPSNTATWQKAKLQGNNDTLILPVNSLQSQTLQLR